ncbi:fibronectin type III domain-containing protein [Streptomyces sp. NBC_01451]|uniref:fibronectin type III domain-containing protein n=1 Tax=Streptomyces sp. NBC_01451 TaxID=2903872 RepID=UPI002E353DAC|nr:fibronectin type III domain-containing protein [Streptomyces sp. NBC_01451]
MAQEKWNLNTTGPLTAEPGSPVGLVNPPLTPDARVAARPEDYGEQVVPPKPLWYLDQEGDPHSHGVTEPYKVLLFWRSNIGDMAADLDDSYYMGVRGLQGIGVAGHLVTVNGDGEIYQPGSESSATITQYWDNTDPENPVLTEIEPETEYTFTVAAHNQAGEYGPASDPLTVTTPAVGYEFKHLTLPPRPPNDVTYAAPLPVITSAAGGGIQLHWTKIANVTKYEIFDNTSQDTTEAMDPSRIGLNESDVKLGEVNQPGANATTVTYTTPNYTAPRRRFALKVRAVRTDDNGTAVSEFSTPLRGTIPASTVAPGTPGAPTLTTTPIVGGQVKLTITPPTIDSTHGAPEYYAVYDGTRKVAVVYTPLGTAPHVTLQYTAAQTYSFTVAAGNSVGVSAASTALTGTVPTPAAPGAPTGVGVTNVTTTGMTVNWTAPAGANPPVTSYKVYDGSTVKATITAPTVTANLTGYSPDTAYSIQVAAVNSAGEGSKSTPAVTGTTPAS